LNCEKIKELGIIDYIKRDYDRENKDKISKALREIEYENHEMK
jgi:hypothetical protein